MTTREEDLAWCRGRAFEYADRGDPSGAMASMISDLKKHPELADHPAILLGSMLLFSGHLDAPGEARKFIEGFN